MALGVFGFTLMFGSLLVKNFQIYYLFFKINFKQEILTKPISSLALFMVGSWSFFI